MVATAAIHPDFTFFSEDLSPRHFSDKQNGWMYYAIREIAKRDKPIVDAFNIQQVLYTRKSTEVGLEVLPVASIDEFLSLAPAVARTTKEEYRVLVDNVVSKAFARDAASTLAECVSLCHKEDAENLQALIYKQIEDLIFQYQKTEELKLLSQRVRELWEAKKERSKIDTSVEFPYPSLNKYCKMERKETIVISAEQKRGKSIMMMNNLVKLLKEGKSAIYIDSETDTDKFFDRLLAHLARVPYTTIHENTYTEEQSKRLTDASDWIEKQTKLIHVYVPTLDDSKLVSLVKRAYHTHKIDAVFLDYIKANGKDATDAYKNSVNLGLTLDLMKNYIGGAMDLYTATAVQATEGGKVAFSKNIARNCSTLMFLERKSSKEIEADGGEEYGNMKLTVQDNRNGPIMADDEYISLLLEGDLCTFSESKQPRKIEPY